MMNKILTIIHHSNHSAKTRSQLTSYHVDQVVMVSNLPYRKMHRKGLAQYLVVPQVHDIQLAHHRDCYRNGNRNYFYTL